LADSRTFRSTATCCSKTASSATVDFSLFFFSADKEAPVSSNTTQLYALELDPPPNGVTVERQLTLKVP